MLIGSTAAICYADRHVTFQLQAGLPEITAVRIQAEWLHPRDGRTRISSGLIELRDDQPTRTIPVPDEGVVSGIYITGIETNLPVNQYKDLFQFAAPDVQKDGILLKFGTNQASNPRYIICAGCPKTAGKNWRAATTKLPNNPQAGFAVVQK